MPTKTEFFCVFRLVMICLLQGGPKNVALFIVHIFAKC